MSPELLFRVRAEYREMPGLQLTFAQACRLWQLDPTECDLVLQTLVKEQFLARTQGGAFVALESFLERGRKPTNATNVPVRPALARS